MVQLSGEDVPDYEDRFRSAPRQSGKKSRLDPLLEQPLFSQEMVDKLAEMQKQERENYALRYAVVQGDINSVYDPQFKPGMITSDHTVYDGVIDTGIPQGFRPAPGPPGLQGNSNRLRPEDLEHYLRVTDQVVVSQRRLRELTGQANDVGRKMTEKRVNKLICPDCQHLVIAHIFQRADDLEGEDVYVDDMECNNCSCRLSVVSALFAAVREQRKLGL